MSKQQMILSGHRRHSRKRGRLGRGPVLRAAFAPPAAGGATAIELPGLLLGDDEEDKRRAWKSALFSLLFHFGGLAILLIIAAVTRVIPDDVLPVQLIRDDTPPESAPAPKALAERRSTNFNPAVQAIQPRIVTPRVVARATAPVKAQALQMDSVSAVQAPTQVQRNTAVVERVSAVKTRTQIRAATVDVSNVGGPVVRGPVQVSEPVNPNAGPRQVYAARTGTTVGLAPVQIGGDASSVETGIVTGRDIEGSPAGIQVASVDTQIGDGYLGGSGGTGNGVDDASPAARGECFQRADVNRYLVAVKDRTIERWVLPPGLNSDQSVTLNFRIDAAGSATRVSVVRASDNALGASAVDALRTAAPFPPMEEAVRCLAGHQIRATFTNPTGS
jgi:TonB family protein